MKELVFRAKHIETNDYGYIHFSTSSKRPSKEDNVLLLQIYSSASDTTKTPSTIS